MMPATVFVVSDLHLGGKPGFQMCSPAGQARLAAFFGWVASRATESEVELVLAGDLVDFLAEEDTGGGWSAFTIDEGEALLKLDRILEDTAPVWSGLSECAVAGAAITLMLGNHDIELALPRLRRRMLERLGPGRIDFLCDNQAYTRGKLLVEHGNRYEGWNVVDHDALRRLRSRLSRGEAAEPFPAQPGSLLVARVMNKLKEQFAWVDLLKPETSGVVPVLAALGTSLWRRVGPAIESGARAAWRQQQFDLSGVPTDDRFVGERTLIEPTTPDEPFPDEDIFAWIDAHVAGDETSMVGGFDDLKADLLFAALRKWAEKDGRTFALEREDSRYLRAATTLCRRGYDVVVFGHTHHVKKVRLPEAGGATYLNTGTWADLIRFPEELLTGEERSARAAFDVFLGDLKANRIDAIRRLLPTFARIDLDGAGNVTAKDVLFFDGADQVTPATTEGALKRLVRE